MQERYIAPAIMLIAGAITSILNIVNDVEFLYGLKRLLLVLIIFYIIGKIATKVIHKVTSVEKKNAETEETIETENEELTEETADIQNQ